MNEITNYYIFPTTESFETSERRHALAAISTECHQVNHLLDADGFSHNPSSVSAEQRCQLPADNLIVEATRRAVRDVQDRRGLWAVSDTDKAVEDLSSRWTETKDRTGAVHYTLGFDTVVAVVDPDQAVDVPLFDLA